MTGEVGEQEVVRTREKGSYTTLYYYKGFNNPDYKSILDYTYCPGNRSIMPITQSSNEIKTLRNQRLNSFVNHVIFNHMIISNSEVTILNK